MMMNYLTSINRIQKIRTSHYSAKMLRLSPIILARKVVLCVIDQSQSFDCFVDFFFYLFNPPKMPNSKIFGGSFEPPFPPPHPTGLNRRRFAPLGINTDCKLPRACGHRVKYSEYI